MIGTGRVGASGDAGSVAAENEVIHEPFVAPAGAWHDVFLCEQGNHRVDGSVAAMRAPRLMLPYPGNIWRILSSSRAATAPSLRNACVFIDIS